MINEKAILPWVRAEVEAEVTRLQMPGAVELPVDVPTTDDLEAKRRRTIESFIDGLIDKAERDVRLGAIADELDRAEKPP